MLDPLRIATVILAGLAIAASVSIAQDKTPATVVRDAVPGLVEQLSAAALAERTQAVERLVALGPEALPFLPAPDLLSSVAARQAIRSVRVRLEHEAARRSIAASRLTLSGEFSLPELTRQIEQQTENRSLHSDLKTTVKVDWKQTPFWDAVESLKSDKLELHFSSERSGFQWRPQAAATSNNRVYSHGPFRLTVLPVTTRAPEAGQTRLWQCSIGVSSEPRIRPLFLRYAAGDFSLLGPNEEKLAPYDSDARVELPLGNGGRESRVELRFVGSDKIPESVRVRGQVKLLVAAAEQPIEFLDIAVARGVARRRAGVTVTVTNVRFTQDAAAKGKHSAAVRVTVTYDSAVSAFESHQTWIFHNQVFLEDRTGLRTSQNGGFETLFQNEGSFGVEYHFDNLNDAALHAKFVYLAPTLLIEVPIAIDIADVPVR